MPATPCSSAGEMPRRIPRTPTSAPSSRSWLRDSESLRSLTRTTFMPCVSTICLLMQVAREQDLVGLQVAEADVGGGDVEGDALAVEVVDELAPREHERGLVGPLERERRDARKDLAGRDRDVVDGADVLAGGVDDRLAQHLGQVQHGALPPSRARRTAAGQPCREPRSPGSSGGAPSKGHRDSGGARRGSTDCVVSRRPLSSGYRTDGTKKPLRPRGTRGSGACASTRAEAQYRACRQVSLLTSLVVDLALSDVGRAARGVADAAGVPASQIPATLAFALSRRGLFYPLASLDISGQWPVFEQEPHRNGRSVLPRAVNAGRRAVPALPLYSCG